MEYKVGDIVEFMNIDGAMEYGLIKDIVEFNTDGTMFQVAHGSKGISYLSINNIHHRCNKYRVGQRVWYVNHASEYVITDIHLASYNIASSRMVIHYCIRNIANGNEQQYVPEDQLTIRPMNYGLARNDIDKVIFNDPATIIIWKDGTKTVVKTAPGETYSKWAGMALCISKKLYGDRFHRIFREYCGEEEEKEESSAYPWKEWHEALVAACKNMSAENKGGENNGEV